MEVMSVHKLGVGCQIKLEKYALLKKLNGNINCLLLIEKLHEVRRRTSILW